MRRRRGLEHLGARAPAAIREAALDELRDGVVVGGAPRRLHDDLAVPVDADRAQVGDLPVGELGARALGIEIFDAQVEGRTVRAGRKPGDQRRAQVAEVQVTGRARCVATRAVRGIGGMHQQIRFRDSDSHEADRLLVRLASHHAQATQVALGVKLGVGREHGVACRSADSQATDRSLVGIGVDLGEGGTLELVVTPLTHVLGKRARTSAGVVAAKQILEISHATPSAVAIGELHTSCRAEVSKTVLCSPVFTESFLDFWEHVPMYPVMVGFWGDEGAAWPPDNDNALTWLASVRSCAAFLRGVPILAELDESALWELAQHADEVTFPHGETIIEQGDDDGAGGKFYIVRSGSADVVRSGSDGHENRVGRLVCGSYFGELGLLTNRARTASVRVCGSSSLRVFAFDALSFHRLIAEHVLVFRVIRERRRMQRSGVGMRRISLNKLGILEGMPPEDLTYVLESAVQKTHDAGSEVIVEGDVGDRFYVVLDGHVAVERDGAVVATMCPGEFFGETALLFETPRTATVRCIDTVTTWSITRSAFQRLVGHHLLASPGAQERIMQRAQDLLAKLPHGRS